MAMGTPPTSQHQDIERLEESTIPVIVKTEDTVARVLLKGKDPLGPQLFDFLGVPGGKVQAFYRGDELDNEATMEESGIDAEATLMVRVMAISFEEVVQALLFLNPKVSEEKAKTGAQHDADGNLISWDLRCLPITKLPECIGGLKSLTTLNLSGSFHQPMKLQSLPDSMWSMVHGIHDFLND